MHPKGPDGFVPFGPLLLYMGFEKGMSTRRKRFVLLQMLQYEVDESFPRITPESFDNGMMPKGIQSITFKVDLTGLHSVRLL